MICPACDTPQVREERFCEACGLPLVFAEGEAPEPKSDEAATRARKVRPGYAEGPLVRVASARHQAEAEMIQGLLLEEGIPSLAQRSGGFDVPDFLAAGPRVILVAASGVDAARELLGDYSEARRLPPERQPAWVRALAISLTVLIVTIFAATVALPLFN